MVFWLLSLKSNSPEKESIHLHDIYELLDASFYLAVARFLYPTSTGIVSSSAALGFNVDGTVASPGQIKKELHMSCLRQGRAIMEGIKCSLASPILQVNKFSLSFLVSCIFQACRVFVLTQRDFIPVITGHDVFIHMDTAEWRGSQVRGEIDGRLVGRLLDSALITQLQLPGHKNNGKRDGYFWQEDHLKRRILHALPRSEDELLRWEKITGSTL